MRASRYLLTVAGCAFAVIAMGTVASAAAPDGIYTLSGSAVLYGGFEDTSGPTSDYAYNDVVFELTVSGPGTLQLNYRGSWYSPPPLASLNGGTPFWANPASEGTPPGNIGYCIYAPGGCPTSGSTSGGINAGLAPGANYLAGSGGVSDNFVYFLLSANSTATLTVLGGITDSTDNLYWAGGGFGDMPIAPLNACGGTDSSGVTGTSCTITSGTSSLAFVLVGSGNGDAYASKTNVADSSTFTQTIDTYGPPIGNSGGNTDHFAFFVTPEPSPMYLFGTGLLGLFAFPAFSRRRIAH